MHENAAFPTASDLMLLRMTSLGSQVARLLVGRDAGYVVRIMPQWRTTLIAANV